MYYGYHEFMYVYELWRGRREGEKEIVVLVREKEGVDGVTETKNWLAHAIML